MSNKFEYIPDDYIFELEVIEEDIFGFKQNKTINLTKLEFLKFIDDNDATIASNGCVYQTKTSGLIPSILNTWFNERISYKNQMKQFEEGSDEYIFYDRKQLITKILLNSFYGVLLLPSFRFYDKQNGEAVTLSGQDIIKFSSFAVDKYNKEKYDIQNSVIYVDTDSLYLQSGIDHNEDLQTYNDIILRSNEICAYINHTLEIFAKRHFNCKTPRLKFNQEKISKRAFWGSAKKRYAQLVFNTNGDHKIDVKGLDMVRSSFPKIFRSEMKDLINDILHDTTLDKLNLKVRNFKQTFKKTPLQDILLPTSVKELSKFNNKTKGTPIHVKSAQNYNRLLDLHKIESIPKIDDGDKILYGYLKTNPFGFETLALKGIGEENPPEIVSFLEKYVDREKIFENTFLSKLETIWTDLGWGKIELTEPNNFF